MKALIGLTAAILAAMATAAAAEGTVEDEIAKIETLADQARAADVSKDVKCLFEADLNFAADARKRHVSDAFADRFLADSKSFSSGQPIVVGPEAIRAALKASTAEWYWAPVEGKADGYLGVTWGRAFLVVRGKDGGEDRTFRSNYVTVWTRKNKKSDWKIWLDLGVQAPSDE